MVVDHLKKCSERTKERVEWLTRLEERPCTLDDHYYVEYRDKLMAHYKQWRQQDRNPLLIQTIANFKKNPGSEDNPNPLAKILGGLDEMGMNTVAEEIAKLLPPDPMEPA